jgi:hypothetical protein
MLPTDGIRYVLENVSEKSTASLFMVKGQASCSLLLVDWLLDLLLDHEDEGATFLWHVGQLLPDYTASHPARHCSSRTFPTTGRPVWSTQPGTASPVGRARMVCTKFNGYTLKGLHLPSGLGDLAASVNASKYWPRFVTDVCCWGERFHIYVDTVRLCQSATSLACTCSGLVWLTCKYDFVPTVNTIYTTNPGYVISRAGKSVVNMLEIATGVWIVGT